VVAGVELAARYVPGHRTGVGGDWYDVFTLPSGVIGIVVGDVSGHGLAAAVTDATTRVALAMEFVPEGLAEKVADATNLVERRVEGDLKRFKQYIESRGTETGGWRGSVA
jgi:phosphoserine phosphatase RsbU/P